MSKIKKPIRQKLPLPFEKASFLKRSDDLTYRELAGLELYGGFHGKPRNYKRFREMFLNQYQGQAIYNMSGFNRMAYIASLLFGDTEKFLTFYHRAGSKKKYMNFMYGVNLPKIAAFPNIDFAKWGDFLTKYGGSSIAIEIFANCAPFLRPQRSLQETIIKAAAAINDLNPQASTESVDALLLLQEKFRINSESFYKAARWHFAAASRARCTNKYDFPEIRIEGAKFGINGGVFRRLPYDDPRFAFVGNFTLCCEKVGGELEMNVEHALKTFQSAFYVVENADGEIIAHSWAWLSEEGDLVFDGFEGSREFKYGNLRDLLDCICNAPDEVFRNAMLGQCGDDFEIPIDESLGVCVQDLKGTRGIPDSQYSAGIVARISCLEY